MTTTRPTKAEVEAARVKASAPNASGADYFAYVTLADEYSSHEAFEAAR